MDNNIRGFFNARGSSGGGGGGRGNSNSRGGGSHRGHHSASNTSEYNSNIAESPSQNYRGNGRGRGRGRGRGGFMSPAKAERARKAKETINVTIPHILAHDARAKAGVEGAIKYSPKDISPLAKSASTYLPKLSVINSDTFDGALSVINKIVTSRAGDYNSGKIRVGVLNMASNTQPGGGVLNGAQAQEETLCRRSTLYPSLLAPTFHPLAPGAIIFTSDVLVFMDQKYEMLKDAERYYVDVISAAAPKRPDLKTVAVNGVQKKTYEHERDLEGMVVTIKNMLRVAVMRGVTHVVLGAFGCGAYGNPNDVVSNAFKRVICGRTFTADKERFELWEKEEREVWSGIEEIVFAIYGDDRGKGNLDAFQDAFSDVIKWQQQETDWEMVSQVSNTEGSLVSLPSLPE